MSLQLHPNEVNLRLNTDNPEILQLAETLGKPYVEAALEQSRRQNLIYLTSLQTEENNMHDRNGNKDEEKALFEDFETLYDEVTKP